MAGWVERLIWNASVQNTISKIDAGTVNEIKRSVAVETAGLITENCTYMEVLCFCLSENYELIFACLEEHLRFEPNPAIFDPLANHVLSASRDSNISHSFQKMLTRVQEADLCEFSSSTKAWVELKLKVLPSGSADTSNQDPLLLSADSEVGGFCYRMVEENNNMLVYDAMFPEISNSLRFSCIASPCKSECLCLNSIDEANVTGFDKRSNENIPQTITCLLSSRCNLVTFLVMLYERKIKFEETNLGSRILIHLKEMESTWFGITERSEKRLLLVDLNHLIKRTTSGLLSVSCAQLVCVLFGSLLDFAFAEDRTKDNRKELCEDSSFAIDCWVTCMSTNCHPLQFMSIYMMLILLRERNPSFIHSEPICSNIQDCILKKAEKLKVKQLGGDDRLEDMLCQIKAAL